MCHGTPNGTLAMGSLRALLWCCRMGNVNFGGVTQLTHLFIKLCFFPGKKAFGFFSLAHLKFLYFFFLYFFSIPESTPLPQVWFLYDHLIHMIIFASRKKAETMTLTIITDQRKNTNTSVQVGVQVSTNSPGQIGRIEK